MYYNTGDFTPFSCVYVTLKLFMHDDLMHTCVHVNLLIFNNCLTQQCIAQQWLFIHKVKLRVIVTFVKRTHGASGSNLATRYVGAR